MPLFKLGKKSLGFSSEENEFYFNELIKHLTMVLPHLNKVLLSQLHLHKLWVVFIEEVTFNKVYGY